jgi:hypothetical protein
MMGRKNTYLLAQDVEDTLQGSGNAVGGVYLKELDLIAFGTLPITMLGRLTDERLDISDVATFRLRTGFSRGSLAMRAEQGVHVLVEVGRDSITILIEPRAERALLEACLAAVLPALSNALGTAKTDSCQQLDDRCSAARDGSVLDKD